MLVCYLSLVFIYNHVSKYWLLISSACYIQIEEVRIRLNLDVTAPSGSPDAPTPIETFTDMVLDFISFSIIFIFLLGTYELTVH